MVARARKARVRKSSEASESRGEAGSFDLTEEGTARSLEGRPHGSFDKNVLVRSNW